MVAHNHPKLQFSEDQVPSSDLHRHQKQIKYIYTSKPNIHTHEINMQENKNLFSDFAENFDHTSYKINLSTQQTISV